jgi:hypothetical protein
MNTTLEHVKNQNLLTMAFGTDSFFAMPLTHIEASRSCRGFA